jgi:trigger factor
VIAGSLFIVNFGMMDVFSRNALACKLRHAYYKDHKERGNSMIAEQNVREMENSEVELTITVPKGALADEYQKTLQKYMKTLQLPGFRKGKAPASVIEKKIGDGMREETIYTVIDEAVKEALEAVEEKYRPLPYSSPEFVDEAALPKTIEEDLVFAVKYDVFPIFDVPAYTGISVEIPKVEISDEVINKELEKLRDQNALVVEKNGAVAEGDIVTVDYVELDAEGNEVAGTERKDFIFTVGSGTNFYKIDSDVVGMLKGETKTIVKTYGEDHEHAEYVGKTVSIRVTLNVVKVREVPELDDDFAQDVSEEYKTLADLVTATRSKLEASLKGHLEETKLTKLLDKILEDVTIAVPASMINAEVDSSWRKFVSQSGMPEAQILKFLEFQGQSKDDFTASWRESAEKNLKIQLIMEKVKEKENFELDATEVEAVAADQLKDVTDEKMKAYYMASIEDEMKFKKAGEFLLANNTIIEGESVSYDDFMAGHQH